MNPKDIAVIVPYFNAANDKTVYKNAVEARAQFKERHKIDHYIIELVYPSSNPGLSFADSHKLYSNSIMWQKERLLNFMFKELGNQYKAFLWCDSDVVFTSETFATDACEALERSNFIQPFSNSFRLSKESSSVFFETGNILPHDEGTQYLQGAVSCYKSGKCRGLMVGDIGLAWGATKEWLEKARGLVDWGILGGGDYFTLSCINGFRNPYITSWFDFKLNLYYKNLPKTVIDFVPGNVIHLYHGKVKNRRYKDRYEIAKKYDYNPITDIKISGGTFEWASDKPDFHQEVKDYFFQRAEDE